MSILLNSGQQGHRPGAITGREGGFHSERMKGMGTALVGRCESRPRAVGEGGRARPLFNTVAEAVIATGANATGIFVPPPFAADAIMEGRRRRDRPHRLHHRGHPDPGT